MGVGGRVFFSLRKLMLLWVQPGASLESPQCIFCWVSVQDNRGGAGNSCSTAGNGLGVWTESQHLLYRLSLSMGVGGWGKISMEPFGWKVWDIGCGLGS